MKQQRQQTGGVCCACTSTESMHVYEVKEWRVQQVTNEDVSLQPSAPLLSSLFLDPLYPHKVYEKLRRRESDPCAPVKPSINILWKIKKYQEVKSRTLFFFRHFHKW